MRMTNRSRVLEELTSRIVQVEHSHPLRVGIDGPDAAGKTTLAEELSPLLQARARTVIRASIDGFHNPTRVRHRRGSTSPEGYYYDSFNYQALTEFLLAPLGPGGDCRYRTAVFDYRTDSELRKPTQIAQVDSVLLFDGVFLLRSELLEYWDFTVFVEADFETTLARAERRDTLLFGNVEEVRKRYKQRYIPGQQLYFETCKPQLLANVVVNNNDPRNPLMSEFEVDSG